MAKKMKMVGVLVSLLPILTFVSLAHARHIEETGIGQALDDEGKTMGDLCKEAQRDAERKVPPGAKDVRYTPPVFRGHTLHGKRGHNCLVYVFFETNKQAEEDEINSFINGAENGILQAPR